MNAEVKTIAISGIPILTRKEEFFIYLSCKPSDFSTSSANSKYKILQIHLSMSLFLSSPYLFKCPAHYACSSVKIWASYN